jgi:hypothetical protein
VARGPPGPGQRCTRASSLRQLQNVVLRGAVLDSEQRPLAGGDHKHLVTQHDVVRCGIGVQVRRSSSLTGGSLGGGGIPGPGAGLHSQQQQLLAQQLLAQQVCKIRSLYLNMHLLDPVQRA